MRRNGILPGRVENKSVQKIRLNTKQDQYWLLGLRQLHIDI